ncbi:hypothetical protein [Streptomyces sp. NPDC101178]|uniref:hypothetical protein n=1 Tax=Streptomyces sp. NPDC101178 TaxID=3366124 RepID=UPI00381DCAD5
MPEQPLQLPAEQRTGRRVHQQHTEPFHQDVDDADYVTALKVLRQMIHNTGGDPDR